MSLIKQLRAKGVQIALVEGSLVVGPENLLTPDRLAWLKEKRETLIGELRREEYARYMDDCEYALNVKAFNPPCAAWYEWCRKNPIGEPDGGTPKEV